MRTCKDLIGLPVIELCTGHRIAEVSGVLCGVPERSVLALVVQTGKLFRKKGLVDWSDIYSLGVDAVTVQASSMVRVDSKGIPPSTETYLRKQFWTTGGQILGRVEDIAIDPKTGRIVGCVLTDGWLGDLLNGRAIIPLVENAIISEEHMIVPDEPRGSENGKKYEMPDVR